MNQGLVGPAATNLRLDNAHKMFATNPDGTIVLSESTGKRIPIAPDIITGKWWMKVDTSMPFGNSKDAKAKLDEYLDNGALHFHAEDEHFRGVWVPMEEPAEPVSGTLAPRDAGSATSAPPRNKGMFGSRS